MGDIPIGIDFGTSYSCVAVCRDGKVEVIANENDSRLTPSYVAFTEEERLFGEAAKYQAPLNLQNTIHQTKRLLGGKHDEKLEKYLGYNISRTSDQLRIPVTHQRKEISLSPEQISAMIIGKMKKIAENKLGEGTVSRAVISVPASFDKAQQKAIFNAGKIAGFAEVRLIHETTAAAVAYGLDREKEGTRSVLITDFGGGKFDAAIVAIDKRKFDVVASTGNSTFGGQDIDIAFAEDYIEEEDRKDKKAICRLQTACEKAKRALSGATKTRVSVDYFTGGKPFKTEVRREDFVINHKDIFSEVHKILEDVLRKGKMKKDMVDEIVLVGGSTRIPKIREIIKEYFDKELSRTINPDEAVAIGAAYHAYYTFHKPIGGYEITGENVPDPKADDNLNELRKQHIQFDKDDKAITENSDARNELENYVNSIKKMVRRPKRKDELTEEQKKKILELCTTTIDWLDDHQDATKNETDEKRKSLEEFYTSQVANTVTDPDNIKMREEKDKLINDIKEITNKVQDERFDSFTKKEDILQKYPPIISWLENEKRVTLEDIYKMREDLKENFYIPLQRFEKHKENERETSEKARSDLKKYIVSVTGKANEKQFEICTKRTNILEQCQLLKTWLNNNPNATTQEINTRRQEFSTYCDQLFLRMEHNIQRENQHRVTKGAIDNLKKVIEINETKAKQQPFEKYRESEKILRRCNDLKTWLENKNVKLQEINTKGQEFSDYCTQIYGKIEDNKQEHERETLEKARNDLKKYIASVAGKANEKQFDKCTERTIILEQCQLLKTWLNNNPNATMQEIKINQQEFSTYCDQLFLRMEQNVQRIEENRKLCSKLRGDLKTYIEQVKSKSQERRFERFQERSIILQNCSELEKWLNENQNVSAEAIEKTQKQYQEYIDEHFKYMENQLQEHGRETLEKARNDLKKYIASVTGKANEKQFDKCTERTNILEQCQSLKTWLNNNPNATMQEINTSKQKFSTYCDQLFLLMEHNIQKLNAKLQEEIGKLRRDIEHIKCKVQDKTFDNFLKKDEIVSNCTMLLKWLDENKKATLGYIEDIRQKYQDFCYQPFEQLKIGKQRAMNELNNVLNNLENEIKLIESDDQELLRLKQQCSDMREDLKFYQDNVSSNASADYFQRIREDMKLLSDAVFQRIDDENKIAMRRLNDMLKKYEDLLEKNLSLLKDDTERSYCNKMKDWIKDNPNASKSDCDCRRKSMEAVYQTLENKIKTNNTHMKRDLEPLKAKAEERQAKARFESYLSDIKEYIQKPANKDRLAKTNHIIITKNCDDMLNWLRSDKVTVAACNDMKRRFNEICEEDIEKLKQEDEAALTELNSYLKTVEEEIKKIKDFNNEYEKQKNELGKIRLWMTNNKNLFKPEYDEKKDELSKIHRNVVIIMMKYGLPDHNTGLADQQRKAKSDLENYAQDIIDYVNHPEENRLVRHKKKALSNDCDEVLKWMQQNKNASQKKYIKKQEQLVRNWGATIKRMQQEDEDARTKLDNLSKDVSHEVEGRTDEGKKMRRDCQDIRKWLMENPKASKPQCEKKMDELSKIIEGIGGQSTMMKELHGKPSYQQKPGEELKNYLQLIEYHTQNPPCADLLDPQSKHIFLSQLNKGRLWVETYPNAPDFEVTRELDEVQRHCQPILNRLMQNVVLEPPKRNPSLHKDEQYNPVHYQENENPGRSERTFRNEEHVILRMECRKETGNQSNSGTNRRTRSGKNDGFCLTGQHMERQNRPGQVLNKPVARDSPGNFEKNSTREKSTKRDRNKLSTYDRPSSSHPHATTDQRELAIEDLRDYVIKVNQKLNDDNKINSLTAKQRGDISGACNGVKNWLSSKSRTLDELQRKKKYLENKCYIVFEV